MYNLLHMFAIIGLGNPGEKYKNNRHNVGYMMIDYIVDQVKSEKLKVQSGNLKFKTQNAFSSKIYHLGSKILLVKPLTFMNRSGIAVKK